MCPESELSAQVVSLNSMDMPIIAVENLGKKYLLDHRGERQRYTALRDVIAEKAKGIFRFPSGRRSESEARRGARTEDFWALQGVSFDIQQGDVVAIIGRNGAGKSTLLKILSQITEPTTGRVRIRGRVASLLEVGTGFHPELTGRENIYLNGIILGMTHAEIRRKFDEIVAFADVEKFLDTPVKRYSSGMQVRLAFAVAAHLEPEILIVDEVLAVGDAEFQKKCLGKMHDVSKGGRTVLFVSHNMAAVKSLTRSGIVLNRGHVRFVGPTEAAIQAYLQMTTNVEETETSWGRGRHTAIRAARLVDIHGVPTGFYTPGEPIRIYVEMETDGTPGMSLDLFLNDASQGRIGMASTAHFHKQSLPSREGSYVCQFELEPMWLASGRYSVEIKTAVTNVTFDHSVETAMEFEVPFSNPLGHEFDFKHSLGYGTLALLSSRIRFSPISIRPSNVEEPKAVSTAPCEK